MKDFEQEIREIAEKLAVSIYVAADIWVLRKNPREWSRERELALICGDEGTLTLKRSQLIEGVPRSQEESRLFG